MTDRSNGKATYIQSLEQRLAQAEERLSVAEGRVREVEVIVAKIRQAHAESVADFDRTKERLRSNQQTEVDRTRRRLAAAFFEVADNLERTIEAGRSAGSLETLLEGVRLVSDQLFKVLSDFGVVRDAPVGQEFDPARHEALMTIPVTDEALHNRVVEVLAPGYSADGEVLRAAMVQVGRYVPPSEPVQ